MKERETYILKVVDTNNPGVIGLGECAPLAGLSIDDRPDYETELAKKCELLNGLQMPRGLKDIVVCLRDLITSEWPSLYLGFEMALMDLLNGGNGILFHNEFSEGKEPIPINGLIWMGDRDFMRQQIKQKVKAGYTCLKMKVGAIDFEQELRLLTYMRELAPNAIIRVDANGAFKYEEAQKKLDQLASIKIHSIEQPLAAGNPMQMKELSQNSIIPIALDEELIGINSSKSKSALLEETDPKYVVLKPSLLGGFHATEEWTKLAEEKGIGWWITSALESNVGLNAISQFTASLNYEGHQGLGTGQLYTNNIGSPLRISRGLLFFK